jgi:N-acetylneuraminate synthase
MTSIRLGCRDVGEDLAAYFVADIAANHDGDLDRACQLVHLAAEAGADAAKFQNFRAETIVSDAGFRALGLKLSHQATWDRSVFEVYQAASIPLEWTPTLHQACDHAGIDYMTTPYDLAMIDALTPHVSAWKVGSGDVTWHEEIARLAASGKPVLLATGASSMEDVQLAMRVVLDRTAQVVLMQCNTNYSGDLDNFHHISLRVLETYAEAFPGVVLGLSDHTPGHATVLGAVALGARVIEKHFTDDQSRKGPDHAFSMTPADWADMVARTRELEAALGSRRKRVMDNEQETVIAQRRAVRAARDLPADVVLTAGDLVPLRPCPADALPPYRAVELVARRTVRALGQGECVRLEDVS